MDWKSHILPPHASVLDALRALDYRSSQFAVIADEDMRLLGVVTDGNIRRGLLNNVALHDSVSTLMNTSPVAVSPDTPRSVAFVLMETKEFTHLPIVNEQRQLVGIWIRKELQRTHLPNAVVLMAGGLGTRLGELTRTCPKPMLHVGGKPLLEILIRNFVESGLTNFFLAVNYMAEIIEKHFGDGSAFGASITYLKEKKPLGTAGALSLLPERPRHPVLVMNGDILTQVHGDMILERHESRRSIATMVIRQHEMHVPYGIVDFREDGLIGDVREKPALRFPVSAGINVLSPEALDHIPSDQFFDMPDLYRTLLERGLQPHAYEINNYWIDIGRIADYTQANEEFDQFFTRPHL